MKKNAKVEVFDQIDGYLLMLRETMVTLCLQYH